MHYPSTSHRFQDQNRVTYSFAHRVLVKCPHCQQRAEVHTNFSTYRSTLQCLNCHYQHSFLHKQLNLSLNVYCNHCFDRISMNNRVVTVRKQAIRIRCQECGYFQSHQPIGSKLRERHDRRFMTLVECLPDWIKSRENRANLLKLIEKLKRM